MSSPNSGPAAMAPQPASPASRGSSHPRASSHPHETGAGDEASARRERIIQAAFAIGQRGGLAAISARGVARETGTSVGYLYKIFPSKSDIMVAAAQRYFEVSFVRNLCRVEAGESYVDYCERLWDSASSALQSFRSEWLRDLEDLPKADLLAARSRMIALLSHGQVELEGVLRADTTVNWTLLPEGTTASSIAEFTMRSLLTSLERGDKDCAILLTFLKRGLYSPA